MGNRRFSVTTYVLVGISLVALYFVGKSVNPAPPAPPKEEVASATKPPQGPIPENSAAVAAKKKMQDERMAQESKVRAAQIRQMAAQSKVKPGVKADEFNATAIQTTADYWQHYTDGKKGEALMAAKVAAAAKAKANTPAVPTPKPSAPVPPAP